MDLDPIKYEIFLNRLRSVLEEGRLSVAMVSGSPAIAEGGECMTSFYDGEGKAILTASGTLFHVTGSGDAILKTIEWYEKDPGIKDGDQFFFGDPYIAGTHLMDQIMIKPVFYEGKRVAWVGTMTHTGDTGGVLRGISTEIFHEGVRIPGMKLVEEGKIRPDLLKFITEQCRDPDYVGLDIMARIASNNVCADGFIRLVEKFGMDFIDHAGQKLRSDAEELIRQKLKNLPDGTWRQRVYWSTTRVVDGKEEVRPFKVMVTLSKQGEKISVDASETSSQNGDYRNATFVAARSNLFSAIAGFLFWDIPWNAGMIDSIDLSIPEGSVLNCRYPASCGYATAVGLMLTDSLVACLARMLYSSGEEENINSAWGVSFTGGPGFWYGGHNQYGGIVGSAIYDLFAAGNGATPVRDGVDTGGLYQNARSCISDVEWIESYFPFLFLARRQATDSSGYGMYRGGLALESLMMVYGTNDLSVDFSPTPVGGEVRSWGLFGGYPVGNYEGGNILFLTAADNINQRFRTGIYPVSFAELNSDWGMDASKKNDFYMERQLGGIRVKVPELSILAYQYGSGGGYGDPLDRNPQLVLSDFVKDAVSLEVAASKYGVIISPDTLSIDEEKTRIKREEIRRERLSRAKMATAESYRKRPESARRIRKIHQYLELYEEGEKKFISCVKCGHVFCEAGDNYKKHAMQWTKNVREMKKVPENEESITFYQEYYCPGCATLLQVDTWCPQIDTTEPLWEINVALGKDF